MHHQAKFIKRQLAIQNGDTAQIVACKGASVAVAAGKARTAAAFYDDVIAIRCRYRHDFP
jgi:hypothetical protein